MSQSTDITIPLTSQDLNSLIAVIKPIILGSNLFLAILGLYLCYKAVGPLYSQLMKLFDDIFKVQTNNNNTTKAKEFDDKLTEQFSQMAKNLRKKASETTQRLIRWADNFYFFNNKLINTKSKWDHFPIIKNFQFISWKTFIVSWLMSLIYLCGMMLFLGLNSNILSESYLWQFLVLMIFYLGLLYIIRQIFKGNKISSTWLRILLAGVVGVVGVVGVGVVGVVGVGVGVGVVGVVGVVVVGGVGVVVVVGVGGVGVVVGEVERLRVLEKLRGLGLLGVVEKLRGLGVLVGVLGLGVLGGVVGVLGVVGLGGEEVPLGMFNVLEAIAENKLSNEKDIFAFFYVFFLLMPLLNALLDSLSLSVSRYEFQKLIPNSKNNNHQSYSLKSFLKISLNDFVWAIIFKLGVLFLLYVSANLWESTGATFQIAEIKAYWHELLKFVFDGSKETCSDFLFKTNSNTLITLMIGTTLIPTFVHFSVVCINCLYYLMGAIFEIISNLFTGNARFFAAVISFVILCFIILVFYLIIDFDKIS